MSTWSRLVRFQPASAAPNASPLIGEPIDPTLDVGLATYNGDKVEVEVFNGSSILAPGERTGRREVVGTLLCPLQEEEVGSIRCIGLNYVKHAKETGIALPKAPIIFLKPAAALTGPFPAHIPVPIFTQHSDSADYESELGVIISKDCKNVKEEEAMEYVLGYTATNDVSSRERQFGDGGGQWCFSKGFDGSAPAGPAVVSASSIPDPSKLYMKGFRNGQLMQESGLDDLIFSVPQLVSYLSQGTTLKAGTLILTGTPHGIGWFAKPKATLQDGDEFRVEVTGGIGTLINRIVFEK